MFVVDAANGPGTNFTSVAAAVAAVPDGAILEVRPGTYGPFTIDAKGLTVFGDQVLVVGPPFQSNVIVRNTAPNQAVVLRGITVWQANLSVMACAGLVVLEDVTADKDQPPNSQPVGGKVTAHQCAQVILHGVTAEENLFLYECTAAVSDCYVPQRRSWQQQSGMGTLDYGASPGIRIWDSTVDLADCIVDPAYGLYPNLTAPAIEMASGGPGAVVRVRSGSYAAGTYWPNVPWMPAIAGSGSVTIDPATTFVGPAVLASPLLQQSSRDLPLLTTTAALLGGTVTATVHDPLGDLAILAIGLPGAPALYPGIAEALWLDPMVWVFQAIGTAPLTAQKPIPNDPGFLGLRLMWQGVTFAPGTGLQATGPRVGVLR